MPGMKPGWPVAAVILMMAATMRAIRQAAKIKGTLVNQVLHNDNPPELVRIGHPAGMIPCYSEVDENNTVKKAAIVRTARRLMEGYALLEKARFE